MAIDHQAVTDPQYDLMRNAPTPKLNGDYDVNMLGSNDFLNSLSFGDLTGANNFNAMLQSNQTIVFQQGPGTGSGQMYPDAMSGAVAATPAHLNVHPSFYAHGSFPNVSQYTGAYEVSGRESVTSQLSTRAKEKCMTRNAIAARENRQKKKNEVNSLRIRVASMEEENALIKKKYNEIKEAYKSEHERLKYYDALFSNFTSSMGSVGPIVEHLKKLQNPGMGQGKVVNEQIKEKFNIKRNLSICCVIGENRDMTLRFCESCSGGSSSKKKAVET